MPFTFFALLPTREQTVLRSAACIRCIKVKTVRVQESCVHLPHRGTRRRDLSQVKFIYLCFIEITGTVRTNGTFIFT